MTATRKLTRIQGSAPAFPCPACGASGTTRSSEAITPTLRRLYYRCSDLVCGMSWTAHLTYETTLSPSSHGPIKTIIRPKRSEFPAPVVALIQGTRHNEVGVQTDPDRKGW